MAKRLVSFFLLFVSLVAWGQNFEESIHQNPARAGAYHHAYEYISTPDTPAPDGYTPFYIAHYSRHGSRYGTNPDYEKSVVEALEKAKEKCLLTRLGEELLTAERTLIAKEEGLGGQLTVRGMQEQIGIASRMYDRFPEVFNSEARNQVRCVSTTVQRCMMSLMNFVESLKKKTSGIEYTMMCADTLQSRLGGTPNLSLARSVYKETQNKMEDAAVLPIEGFASRIFTDPVKAADVIGYSLDDFAYDAFYSSTFFECVDLPELNTTRYFTEPEIVTLGSFLNAKIYISNMNTPLMEGKRINDAAPFLKDIIEKADRAVAGNEVAADLRFAHDSGLLPLLALAGIGVNSVSCDPTEAHKYWTAGENVCMASNIQLIFYRNKPGDVLVKVLQNEQEKSIDGLTPVCGPYYRWASLRAFWLAKMM